MNGDPTLLMVAHAFEYATSGIKFWYWNGKLHRRNQPAIERVNGDKHWYWNGQLHSRNQPAIEYTENT
jgi:hypothetical protein